jgi:hypothetical protein
LEFRICCADFTWKKSTPLSVLRYIHTAPLRPENVPSSTHHRSYIVRLGLYHFPISAVRCCHLGRLNWATGEALAQLRGRAMEVPTVEYYLFRVS